MVQEHVQPPIKASTKVYSIGNGMSCKNHIDVATSNDRPPPNVRVQPPRAHPEPPSKTLGSRARSGRLERHVRRSGRRRSGCRPHAPTTASENHAGTTGVDQNHAQHTPPPGRTSFERNHAQHTIRLRTTGAPHNGLSYHILHNGRTAQRALVPHPAPRAPARRSGHNGHSRSAIRRIHITKRHVIALPRVPNGLPFSCRERA